MILTEREGRSEGGTVVYAELDSGLQPTGAEWVAARHLRVAPYDEAKAYAEAHNVSLRVAAFRFSIEGVV